MTWSHSSRSVESRLAEKCPPGRTGKWTQVTPIFCFPEDFFFNVCLFVCLWLCRVLVPVRGLSPVAASGGHSSSQCVGLSLSRPLLLWSTGSRRTGSVVVAHGPSCSAACGIFPDQGSNPCPLHQQTDCQPLRQQGSPFPEDSEVRESKALSLWANCYSQQI